MYSNIKQAAWTTYNLTWSAIRICSQPLFFRKICFLSKFRGITRVLSQSWHHSFLLRRIFLGVSFVLSLIISHSSLALTSKTSNIIHGNAPYLTFDGGITHATNTDALLGISLSNGDKFTPTRNNSSFESPIRLPEPDQSFADIGMLIPTDKNLIELNSLIASPYNYWGDDDGDGQGVNGITATGSLRLSIVDKNNQVVTRNEVLSICKAPYKLTLSNTNGTLKTSYGAPNESRFSASNVTYYINPKATSVICFAKPSLTYGTGDYAGPATIWDSSKGFLLQSSTPSSYGLNFPTTGANGLYFDLDIGGSNQVLNWEPVSLGGITATMTPSSNTSVRVTLTGPVAVESQWSIDNPGNILIPSLPQVFELVGRDSRGNAVVKYGFKLKQWFVNRGSDRYDYSNTSSWCANIGYRITEVSDLTNASCQGTGSGPSCEGAVGATPSSPHNYYQRQIGAGFFTEWGSVSDYYNTDFINHYYWAKVVTNSSQFIVDSESGYIDQSISDFYGLCVYP